MAAQQNGHGQKKPSGDTDLAQAFQDLARGEQTAAALETHLDKIEKQIEALLAAADEARESPKQQGDASGSSQGGQGSSNPEANQGPNSFD
ncbi:uncharacterized protein J3D65DRAFT_635934 [Phyllosticta citribraziliensis]|uniref:Uncharacterized protein n=1 Tax=Phyllosticta citribraziliensis TaxID=989973 RepID=A0ABR1LA84_9PEZI